MRLSKHACLIVGVAAGMALSSRSSNAQYTADFQTNIISSVSSNWSGTYYVGNTSANDSLIIQNGGVLSASVDGGLGATYNSSNNFVLVTGPGSLWTMPYGYLILSGENDCCSAGPGNRMVISNGGVVASVHGYIGGYVFNAPGSNSVLVSDPGSAWTMPGQFAVGDNCSLNSLVISNGAVVYNYDGYMGYSSASGFNSAVITGTGSVWSNAAGLEIGSYGGPNTLAIVDGGLVTANYGSIGPRTSSNVVIVSGSGSLWSNQNDVTVGGFGSGNTLVISNGGSLVASNLCIGTVGAGTYGVNPVEGPVGEGILILNGGSISVGGFFATNASARVMFSGGLLAASQTTVSNGPVFVVGDGIQTATFHMLGDASSFASNLWIRANALLTGCATVSGSTLVDGTLIADCGGTFTFGGTSTNNGTIVVQNGTALSFYGAVVNNGLIVATNGLLRGYSTLQNNGTILGVFQDMHDVWTNSPGGKWEDASNWSQGAPTNSLWCVITNPASKTITIDASTATLHPETLAVDSLTLSGANGTNLLSLSSPGTGTPFQVQHTVALGAGGKLALSNAAMQIGAFGGQSLDVDGEVAMADAVLTVTNGLTSVGANSAGLMTVSNSLVVSSDTCLGCAPGASGTLGVTGFGSIWSNTGTMYIGQDGTSDQLLISSGAQMVTSYGHVGFDSASSNNNALVSGSGSVWSNLNDLSVGLSGSGNALLLGGGGAVYSATGVIGSNTTATGNLALITDAGSAWSNRLALTVGCFGAANSVVISNGGWLVSGYLKSGLSNYVGYAANNNRVLVSDTGSVWTAFNPITIGYQGSGNSLVVSNGGLVADTIAAVGFAAGSGGNVVLITGMGSTWTNSGSLCVGYSGVGNSLTITNGGNISDTIAYLGYNAGSSNNNVVFTGNGTTWNHRGGLIVGYSGGNNSLLMADGSAMGGGRDQSGSYLGLNSSSSNNTALVTGTGTVWSNSSAFFIGYAGPANSLVVSNGAHLFSIGTVLGSATFSGNNTVIITGSGSVLSNSSTLYVGYGGSGNNLMIDDGGQFVNRLASVGNGSSSSNNTVKVAGNALWQNGALYVGYQGSSNALVIDGGSVLATGVTVGVASTGCNNRLEMDGGSLAVTNSATNAVLEVRNGAFLLNGGTLLADKLVVTNACARFIRNGGTASIATLVLDPSLSAVGDGIPNGWKQQYGLDPLDPTVATADADGDGLSALQEYLAGTDPTNASSAFRITAIAATGPDVRVYFTSVSGKYYSLQRADSLGGLWSAIVTNIPGNGGIQWAKDSGGASRTNPIYRISLSQLTNSPPPDSDGDGLPDSWTQAYFGHPTGQSNDLSCATCDADATGQNNLFKYVAGLDPTNPASFFVLNIASATNQPSRNNLLFQPLALGRTYTPQFTTNLTAGSWLPLTSYTGPITNGSQITITDTNPLPPQEFYRIDISLP